MDVINLLIRMRAQRLRMEKQILEAHLETYQQLGAVSYDPRILEVTNKIREEIFKLELEIRCTT